MPVRKGHTAGVFDRENSLASVLPFFCRPLRCLQHTHVIHHGDINYVLGSSRTKTLMKGLSTQAFPRKQCSHGGGRDGGAEPPTWILSWRAKRKQFNCIFTTCIVIMLAQCKPGYANCIHMDHWGLATLVAVLHYLTWFMASSWRRRIFFHSSFPHYLWSWLMSWKAI